MWHHINIELLDKGNYPWTDVFSFFTLPSITCQMAYVLPILPFSASIFNGPLETNYLRMYWTDLCQIFRIGTHIGGHDQSDLFAIAYGTLLRWPLFWHKSAKLAYPAFILCTGRIVTLVHSLTQPMDDPLTSDKNLGELWSSSPPAFVAEWLTHSAAMCSRAWRAQWPGFDSARERPSTKELFLMIPMHMMNREIIPGR